MLEIFCVLCETYNLPFFYLLKVEISVYLDAKSEGSGTIKILENSFTNRTERIFNNGRLKN